MAEEVVEKLVVGGFLGTAFAAAGPLQRLGDELADKYFNGYERKKASIEQMLEKEEPEEESFYRLMGELGEELSGCRYERATDTTVFEAKKDALLEYAEDQSGGNWRWLEERTREINYDDVI